MSTSSIRVDEGAGPYIWTDRRSVSSVNREAQYVLLAEPALPTFSVIANSSVATTADHALQIMASASMYVRIKRITIEQLTNATAATLLSMSFVRLTSAGSGGTSIGVAAYDSASDTGTATAQSLPSSKGTETSILLYPTLPLRQAVGATAQPPAARWEWTPAPGCKPIIIPAGTSNGVALKVIAGVAGATISATVEFTETAWL